MLGVPQVWKAVGMDLSRVEFLSSSEEINKRPDEYWTLVMDIARKNSLKRIIRCAHGCGCGCAALQPEGDVRFSVAWPCWWWCVCRRRCSQIMGRNESDDLSAAQIFYPCMQCADIFFLKADICQLGLDQRKVGVEVGGLKGRAREEDNQVAWVNVHAQVNMLAREYCEDIKRKNKPIILSHRCGERGRGVLLEQEPQLSRSRLAPPSTAPGSGATCCLPRRMMPGLLEGQEKMSKSDPNSAIFMEDSEVEVNTKIKKAFCPAQVGQGGARGKCLRVADEASSGPCPASKSVCLRDRVVRAQVVQGNPCIEYVRYIVFPWFNKFEVRGRGRRGPPGWDDPCAGR